jgi:small subunit ribosomal protein S3
VGQKTHPYGFRLGIIRDWTSRWYEEKKYAQWLLEDLRIKEYIREHMRHAGISAIEIERARTRLKATINTARPGVVIGKKGQGAEDLRQALQKLTTAEVSLTIHEVRKAELDAQLVAENVATQLERRVSFRRAMKKSVATAMRFGAKGVRIACSGRLGGAEMGRYEWYLEGSVPLHTLRADIQYGETVAKTTYGIIGVKCHIYKGEVFN